MTAVRGAKLVASSVPNASAIEFMNSDSDQTRRILDKLVLARAADPEYKVFGASSHRYVVHAPASLDAVRRFEERVGITLPDAFRRFLLEVGCGGDGYEGSAAGPFYGVFGLESNLRLDSLEWLAKVVANPCLLSARMSVAEWEALTSRIGIGGDARDDQFEQTQAALFGGILPIGSQGCSMYHGLVVTGPHTGRVVNFDQECGTPPVFAFEPDFLEWYERWLDEVINGDLFQKGPSWFGYTRGGPESELLAGWLAADNGLTAEEYLKGLLSKAHLSDATLDALIQPHAREWSRRSLVCQVVCKHAPNKAQALLAELAEHEPLAFLQCLHWYAQKQATRWQSEVLATTDHIGDLETFRFLTYVLELLPIDRGSVLAPFVHHAEADFRRQALYALGKLSDRKPYLQSFVSGLGDADSTVVHAALQALRGLADRSLLPHYRSVAERYPVERDYVLANLDHRLKELGMTRQALLQAPVDRLEGETRGSGVWRRLGSLLGRPKQ